MNPIWGWNYKAFCVVFKEIYAAAKKIYATAGPTGPAKYQLCIQPGHDFQLKMEDQILHNTWTELKKSKYMMQRGKRG